MAAGACPRCTRNEGRSPHEANGNVLVLWFQMARELPSSVNQSARLAVSWLFSEQEIFGTSPNSIHSNFLYILVFRCFLIHLFSGLVWDLCNSLVHSPPFPCGIEPFLASSPSTSFSLGCFCPFSSGFGVSLLISPLMRSTLL